MEIMHKSMMPLESKYFHKTKNAHIGTKTDKIKIKESSIKNSATFLFCFKLKKLSKKEIKPINIKFNLVLLPITKIVGSKDFSK